MAFLYKRRTLLKIVYHMRNSTLELSVSFKLMKDFVVEARLLSMKRGSAWRIIRQFQQHGVVWRQLGWQFHVEMDEVMHQEVIGVDEAHSEYTLNQLRNCFRVDVPHKLQVSNSTIRKALKNSIMVLKRRENIPFKIVTKPTSYKQERITEHGCWKSSTPKIHQSLYEWIRGRD